MTLMTKSRSTKKPFSQHELITLERKAAENIEGELGKLALTLKRRPTYFVGPCPIHGGDNKGAFNIFHYGDETAGNWRCFTHSCHKHFHPTVLGFIRGYLSKTKYGWRDPKDCDKECPFPEAVKFLCQLVGPDGLSSDGIDFRALEKHRFTRNMKNVYARQEVIKHLNISRFDVQSLLQIPADYYINRGYTKEILTKYDVGLCNKPGKEMYMRAAVPVYDNNHDKVIGCTGRSIFPCCPLCECYHNPIHQCPNKRERWRYQKWRHNTGFPGENCLYNYWFAQQHIAQSHIAIIVESPGNVWKLEEAGIHNSIATFGAHLTENQKAILDKSGALALIVLTDWDDAGKLALTEIVEMCKLTYSLYTPQLQIDIGDSTIQLIHDKVLPIINKVKMDLGYDINISI